MTAENGVVVQIGPESLDDGVEATLNQWDIDPSWRQALEQLYTIETPFVSLAATGVNDGQGRAMLRLPAAGPDSRLAAVIDNTYIALLEVPPQDGYLETAVRLGPMETGDVEQVGSLVPGGSLQYSVLTPRSSAAAFTWRGRDGAWRVGLALRAQAPPSDLTQPAPDHGLAGGLLWHERRLLGHGRYECELHSARVPGRRNGAGGGARCVAERNALVETTRYGRFFP